MRIEPGDHAGDGVGDQFLLVHRLDILGLDAVEDGGQLLHFFERQRAHRVARHGLQLHGGKRARYQTNGEDANHFEFGAHAGCAFREQIHSGSV